MTQDRAQDRAQEIREDHVTEVYTDGACRGNPGRGGWGVVIIGNDTPDVELSGREPHTTNNRMELMAVIQALEYLDSTTLVLYSDSQYVIKGITEWISGWEKRNWKTANNKPVKNEDLWKRLVIAARNHQIVWKWVKGHSGNHGNERADELASRDL